MPFFIKQKTIDTQINKTVDSRLKTIMQDHTLPSNEFDVRSNSPVVNLRTGQGTKNDIGTGSFFTLPLIINNEQQLETSYLASWAIGKMIDIPVDDMFLRERVIENLPSDQLKMLNDEYDRLGLTEMLPQFIKSARVFGTALMSIISTDDLLINPLNINNIRPGDVRNIIFSDRFQATIAKFQRNALNPRFGKPEEYFMFISGTIAKQFKIHASRVIRLDSKRQLSTTGWRWADTADWWGVSQIVSAVEAIISENSLYSNTNSLIQRASVLIMKIEGLRDANSGEVKDEGGVTQCSVIKSELNTFIAKLNTNSISAIDAENDIMRLEVAFGGLAALFDKYALRVAAVADIPKTRFYNDSPTGFFSNGNGEETDYAKHIASLQIKTLSPIYRILDKLLMRNLGLNVDVEFNFPSLVDLSETQKTQASLQTSQALSVSSADGMITTDEGRQVLRETGEFGTLDGQAPQPVATPDIATAAGKDISASVNNGRPSS